MALGSVAAGLWPASGAATTEGEGFASGGARITAEWFAASGVAAPAGMPAVLLLHGADGLTFGEGYRLAARMLASSGFGVGFVHYLDRTGDRRVSYSRLRQDFPKWRATVADALTWLAARPGVDPGRIGIVGVSLGAALALDVAAADGRVKALVDYFGPLLEGMPARIKRLPPTLILHGERDQIVGVEHARAIEALLKLLGTPYEIRIYPDQGHGFLGPAQLDSAGRVASFLARHLGPKPSAG